MTVNLTIPPNNNIATCEFSIPDDTEADGKFTIIIIDNDGDGGNGYLSEGFTTWTSDTTKNIDASGDVAVPNDYYLYALIDMDDSQSEPNSGDYYGGPGITTYGPLGAENANIPDGPATFEFSMIEVP